MLDPSYLVNSFGEDIVCVSLVVSLPAILNKDTHHILLYRIYSQITLFLHHTVAYIIHDITYTFMRSSSSSSTEKIQHLISVFVYVLFYSFRVKLDDTVYIVVVVLVVYCVTHLDGNSEI